MQDITKNQIITCKSYELLAMLLNKISTNYPELHWVMSPMRGNTQETQIFEIQIKDLDAQICIQITKGKLHLQAPKVNIKVDWFEYTNQKDLQDLSQEAFMALNRVIYAKQRK